MNEEAPSPTADREFVHSRWIGAPRERVFMAFSDPARLARWWGPNGFSSTIQTFDLRAGGAWRFVMHGPDGVDYPNESVFAEVVAPERVVFDHLSGHHFTMTITLADERGGTLVGWRQVFDTAAERERIAPFVLQANEQNLDRLAAEVQRADGTVTAQHAVSEDDLGFSYRRCKDGEVQVLHRGRLAATLRSASAEDFLAEVAAGDGAAAQQLMARVTGNYKRGNEQLASQHPRNRRSRG